MNTNIAILILAAGSSSRMGKAKQLLPFKNTTLLGNAITTANELSKSVFVVLGANASKIQAELISRLTIILNEDWQKGMGTSIQKGITAIKKNGQFDGVLIMVADQPLITLKHYQIIVDSFYTNRTKIIATDYGKRAGVPALFPNDYFEKLATFNQDFGARHLLNSNTESVIRVETTDNLMDIDTPESYELLQKLINS